MKIYNPKIFEEKIQLLWKENKFFQKSIEKVESDLNSNKTFSLILPPPNITGNLHLGHALDSYYPDLLIRYKQMNNYNVFWYPGIDHAGIATQVKIEKYLQEQNKNLEEISKTEFLKYADDWIKLYKANILNQWDKLGIAINYDLLKFTLDSDVKKFVQKVFVDLYNKNLIYYENKIVNWDVKLKTVISNIEVIKKKAKISLYKIRYYFVDDKDKYLDVSTTRPETMFGDTALCVNPKDNRYKKFINKKVTNPINGKTISIIADEYVKLDFGTGVMKITPSHDFNDFILGKKHNLEFINILKSDGKLNEVTGEFCGLDRLKAREKVIKWLDNNGYISNISEYDGTIEYSERTNEIIEPMISNQWFLKTSSLVDEFTLSNLKKTFQFYPLRFSKVLNQWFSNMEDWCISRQLWWGHQIPVWYNKSGDYMVQVESPGNEWKQKEEVLDTWFSSSLWPIVFFDEAVRNKSDNPNYLTDVIFTGYDIILFWIARMIIQSNTYIGKLPFKKVIIHGLLRDSNGKKMSKSLNNGINPIEIIDKWGSDSLRTFLLSNSSPGLDVNFNNQKLKSAWSLNNKLINILNFFESKNINYNFDIKNENFDIKDKKWWLIDQYILDKLFKLQKNITKNIEKYNLPIIYRNIQNYVFEDFSSYYLEIIKNETSTEVWNNAFAIFIYTIIVLHPFLPFTTEWIYQNLKFDNKKSSILEERYISIKQYRIYNSLQLISPLIHSFNSLRKAKSESNFQFKNIEIFLSRNDYYFEFINNYLKKQKAIVKFIDDETHFNNIYLDDKFGIIYYRYDEKTLKSKDELVKNAIAHFQSEKERTVKLLNNPQFIKKAKKSLIKTEKEKQDFFNHMILILKNEI